MRRGGTRWLGAIGLLGLVLWVLAGCEQVIGIEERVYRGAQASEQCQDYCETVLEACVGEHAVYSTIDTCLGVCEKLPVGDPLEPTTDNTVTCRARQAELALSTEPGVHCPRAGPSGDGFCGSECEAYCQLFDAACPDRTTPKCQEKCPALRNGVGFDVARDHDFDTLECRLVHVSSATVDPEAHCSHAEFTSTEWCVDPPEEAPDCGDYCAFVMAACSNDHAQYESLEQCVAVCQTLPPGTNADQSENTVGCRHWHAHSALLDADTHCPHAGPSGDGHCGHDEDGAAANCVAYCHVVSAACTDEFAAHYDSRAACVAECSAEPKSFGAVADSHYVITGAETRDPFSCRLIHAARSLDDASHCAAALGDGDCN